MNEMVFLVLAKEVDEQIERLKSRGVKDVEYIANQSLYRTLLSLEREIERRDSKVGRNAPDVKDRERRRREFEKKRFSETRFPGGRSLY